MNEFALSSVPSPTSTNLNGSTQFETVFQSSKTVDIVANNVLINHPVFDSPVRKALIALFGLGLYGDHRLHNSLGQLFVDRNYDLQATVGMSTTQQNIDRCKSRRRVEKSGRYTTR